MAETGSARDWHKLSEIQRCALDGFLSEHGAEFDSLIGHDSYMRVCMISTVVSAAETVRHYRYYLWDAGGERWDEAPELAWTWSTNPDADRQRALAVLRSPRVECPRHD